MEFSQEIDRATAYCTYCPKMCRFSCPAAEAEKRETVTPWGMMRLFEMVKEEAVEPSDEVAETFYHCMGCRRCQEWCRHDNDVPEALWEARRWMRDLGHVPEALEGFVDDFLDNRAPHDDLPALEGAHGYELDDIFDDDAAILYMPDCETRRHAPDLVARAGMLLEIFHGSKVGLATRREDEGEACCGFPLLSAGDASEYERHRARLERRFETADTVVVECAAMAALYREESSWGREGDLEVVHVVEFLADRLPFVQPREPVPADDLMIHDSCMVGRQLELYEEVRDLARELCDGDPGEFQFAREEAPCCGGPAHYHRVAPEASERCAETRIEQMEREGGEGMICGSATCKKAFRRVSDDDGVAMDLLELACRAFGL
jgi:Fe-S oxidoreductase